jgi:hypothetical protein
VGVDRVVGEEEFLRTWPHPLRVRTERSWLLPNSRGSLSSVRRAGCGGRAGRSPGLTAQTRCQILREIQLPPASSSFSRPDLLPKHAKVGSGIPREHISPGGPTPPVLRIGRGQARLRPVIPAGRLRGGRGSGRSSGWRGRRGQGG